MNREKQPEHISNILDGWLERKQREWDEYEKQEDNE